MFKKIFFLSIKIPPIILVKKILKRQNSFITPKKIINKKNIDKSNKIDNDTDVVTHNRYAPLENIDESFNSCSGDNLSESEINTATQDQIYNNGCRQERKKALIIGDSMVKGIKRWKINKKLKFTNTSVFCFPGANTSDMKH